MPGTIGNLAEQVLEEVRGEKLMKLAQAKTVDVDSQRPVMRTEIGKAIYKTAQALREKGSPITVSDVENFVGAANAK